MSSQVARRSNIHQNINEVLTHNLANYMEHRPGMKTRYRTARIGKCASEKHILVTGLGEMGVGTMWSARNLDEDIVNLPILANCVICECLSKGHNNCTSGLYCSVELKMMRQSGS